MVISVLPLSTPKLYHMPCVDRKRCLAGQVIIADLLKMTAMLWPESSVLSGSMWADSLCTLGSVDLSRVVM